MKTIFSILLTMLIIASCTLNSEQEGKLYKEMTLYIHAHNDCKILARVALTHPLYVKEVKNLGDSTFLEKFQCQGSHMTNNDEILDPLMKGTKSNGDQIEVKFQANNNVNPISFYAISNDKGQKWYFLKENEYQELKKMNNEFNALF